MLKDAPKASRASSLLIAVWAATYMRHGGADMKEIQEVLGHSTLGLTADTYTSVILDLRRPNADANLIPREAA
ncbi:hypothetical protein [Actinoplanes xinjiangensis]|uniref:hypothetical protein n=1 Tax=Actinoplanes xinjiangensis TaxID=512350 RepID=UPI003446A2A2